MRHRLLWLVLLPFAACAVHAQTLSPGFIENKGQWPDEVRFRLQLDGVTMWITDRGAVYDLQERVAPTLAIPSVDPFDRVSEAMAPQSTESARLRGHVLRAEFVDASPDVEAIGVAEESGRYNYFIGNDESRWGRNCRVFSSVRLENIYDGIDAVYYLDKGMPRYDLMVAPGADPAQVGIAVRGAEGVRILGDGRLAVGTSVGPLEMRELLTYQMNDKGERCQVASRFVVDAEGTVRFRVGAHDPALPLVVDPLVFSTLFGGDGDDQIGQIEVDAEGNVYVAGVSEARGGDFPITTGAYDSLHVEFASNQFIAKMSPDGERLLYATFLGEVARTSFNDPLVSIAVNEDGEVYVAGVILSYEPDYNYPVTPDAYDLSSNGFSDIVVSQLSADGDELLYSTFFGSAGAESVPRIAVDDEGDLYLAGVATLDTDNGDFPTTPGAYDQSANGYQDIFVAKLTPGSGGLHFATVIGGQMLDILSDMEVDARGDIYLSGTAYWQHKVDRSDTLPYPTTTGAAVTAYYGMRVPFVTKLAADGGSLIYSTFVSSPDDYAVVRVVDMAVGGDGVVYIAGNSDDGGFPGTPGAYDQSFNGEDDIVVAGVSPDGSAILFSTYLGGTGVDSVGAIAIGPGGDLFLTGITYHGVVPNFPTSPNAYDDTYNGAGDAFVARMSADGSRLTHSTFLGGAGTDMGTALAIDADAGVYVAGRTTSLFDAEGGLFPLTPNAFDGIPDPDLYRDGFISKLTAEVSGVEEGGLLRGWRIDLR